MADVSVISLASGIFLGDLLVKNAVEQKRELGGEESVLGGRVILSRYHNEGAMLDLLKERKGIVRGVSLALTGVVLIKALGSGKKEGPLYRIGISFLLGGALSNTYDRAARGFVVDYFSFACRWKRIRNIVFNLSDLFIFAGAFLMAAGRLRGKKD